ncbi:MAG: hypothetical protein LBE27_06970 [Deltaproteobacteria bacterium]|nr:hypothetical protein [Deltaproteobacteria bacterium]
MNINNAANSLPGYLALTLLESQQKQTELAMKTMQIVAQQQMAYQQQQTALFAVALMTGIGSKLDIVV